MAETMAASHPLVVITVAAVLFTALWITSQC